MTLDEYSQELNTPLTLTLRNMTLNELAMLMGDSQL